MKEFGSYDQGTKVDEWMTFFIEYDINPQFPGDDLYYLTRRAIDTCPAKIQNHTKGTRWLYFYGSGRSNAEVCNAGLKLIYRYGAKGDHACLDPDGNLMQCPPNR